MDGLNRDAFAGGFVAGIVEGKPLDVCVDMGQWLAKLSIKELGPQYVILMSSSILQSLPIYKYRKKKTPPEIENATHLGSTHSPHMLPFENQFR